MEAAKKVIELLFTEGVSVDGKILTVEKLYATTIAENVQAIRVLEKLSFERNTEGPIMIMKALVDSDDGSFFGNCIAEYLLKKKT